MSHRRMTPKGQMSSNGSGPAIMMMKPHIRATFMPDPPLQYIPPPTKSNRNHNHSGKRKQPTHIHNYDNENGNGNESTMNMNGVKPDAALVASSSDTDNNNNNNNNNDDDPNNLPPKTSSLTGVAAFMIQLERSKPPKRTFGKTPQSVKRSKQQQQEKLNQERLAPLLEHYQDEQKKCSGEWEGMNCYNTLFVGRLAYETSERKLLRELETFGPVKDLKLITHKNKSRGYAFVEFEQEEDMKRAYRAADAMRLDGREIVVDVERGHTVPNWLPRRLGGGLGGTRLGGKEKNITAPGRFDPNKKPSHPPPLMMHHHPGMHNPPMHPMHRGGGPPGGGGGPPHGMGGPYGGTPGGPYGGPGGGPYGGGGGGGERGGFDRGGPGPGGGPGGFDRGGPPPPHPMMMGYHNGPPGGPGGFDRDRGGPPGYGGGNNRGGGNWDRDRDRDRWGGGGGGGPPGRGGGYNDRDRGFRRGGGGGGGGAPNDREWERGRYPPGGGPPPPNGGGSGSGGGGYSDRGMKRPRSRSNSPSSRRSRFR